MKINFCNKSFYAAAVFIAAAFLSTVSLAKQPSKIVVSEENGFTRFIGDQGRYSIQAPTCFVASGFGEDSPVKGDTVQFHPKKDCRGDFSKIVELSISPLYNQPDGFEGDPAWSINHNKFNIAFLSKTGGQVSSTAVKVIEGNSEKYVSWQVRTQCAKLNRLIAINYKATSIELLALEKDKKAELPPELNSILQSFRCLK